MARLKYMTPRKAVNRSVNRGRRVRDLIIDLIEI